jgi:caffeoyl-CoA O-methyltransferase
MADNSLCDESIQHYVSGVINREDTLSTRLRAETRDLSEGRMQCHPDLAILLPVLVRATGARRVLEVGTFTGRSALGVAAALPPDGRLVACDVSEEWTRIARRYWNEAGVASKIDLRLGPAAQTLARLIESGAAGSFDLAFIDADKSNYNLYYEGCLQLVRPGGLIALDNMLWSGRVIDHSINDPDTVSLRALNLKIRDDPRVQPCLLTVGDGVMLVCKR